MSGRYGQRHAEQRRRQPATCRLRATASARHHRGQGEQREAQGPAEVGHRVVAVGALGGHVGERAVGDREAHHAQRHDGQRPAEAIDPASEHGQHDRHRDDVGGGVDHREHPVERVALARHVDDAEEGAVAHERDGEERHEPVDHRSHATHRPQRPRREQEHAGEEERDGAQVADVGRGPGTAPPGPARPRTRSRSPGRCPSSARRRRGGTSWCAAAPPMDPARGHQRDGRPAAGRSSGRCR